MFLTFNTFGRPQGAIYYNSTYSKWITSSNALLLNTWTHLAYVLEIPNAFLYLNGTKVASLTNLMEPINFTRTNNFIGRSNGGDPNADAVYDDLKIFKRGLNENEILFFSIF